MKRILIIMLSGLMLFMLFACNAPAEEKEPATITEKINVVVHVKTQDGTETEHKISTDKKMLGAALTEAGLIVLDQDGYIVTVNGITLNWDNDQAYWAFFINDQYADHGVNDEVISPDAIYTFTYTKG